MTPAHYVLADGRQLQQLTPATFKVLDVNGHLLRYVHAEAVIMEGAHAVLEAP